MRIRFSILGAAVALALAASACGGGAKAGQGKSDAQAPSGTVTADLKEFSIATDASTIAAGQVTVVAKNSGSTVHELVVLRTDLAADALPLVSGKANEDAAGISSPGEIQELAAGKSESKTFQFTPGHYLLICNIPGHYQMGMRTALTVS